MVKMVSPKDISLVIVQGSFQKTLVYKGLVDGLRALGYSVFHPELPSCSNVNNPDFPTKTLADDSQAVEECIAKLVHEDKKVAVIMHSYGGLVGSNAIPEQLSFSSRKSQNLPGGVIYLYYFTSFILGENQSVLGTFGESPNNDIKSDGRYYIKDGGNILYNDLPEAERKLWASRLIPQSHAVQETMITRMACRYIPSTYLICENDQAAPPPFQEMFAKAAGSQVDRCSSSHSPMLSQLELLISKIDKAITKAVAQ